MVERRTSLPFGLTPWPYLVGIVVPFTVLLFGVHMLGISWALLVFIFGIIPLLDLAVGLDEANPTKAQERELRDDCRFRWITWAWVPTQMCSQAYGLWLLCVDRRFAHSPVDFVCLSLSIGTLGGLGINVSHELIHKASRFEQNMGRWLLASVCYEHWWLEHLYGHHKRVSTPDDPASAPKGMNAHAFWLRSVLGTARGAWNIECDRLLTVGKHPLNPLENRVIIGTLRSVALFAVALWVVPAAARAEALCYLGIQALMAFSLLEWINYIEHYGLQREFITSGGAGEYEKVTQHHSWNAGHRVTNYLLFKLQRHSDHHAMGARRFQVLRSFPASPQLPTGYAGMILIAVFCPPLWFRLMDGRVDSALSDAAELKRKGIDPFQVPDD